VVCRHVSDKLGCAAGEESLRNTVLDKKVIDVSAERGPMQILGKLL
jgi:hypothetical protein